MDQYALSAIKAWNSRTRNDYKTIGVRPLTNTIGAEITGVNIGAGPSPEQLAEIRTAFHENMVLLFRDQTMDHKQHTAFGRHFGELHLHPTNLANKVADPEIVRLRMDSTSVYAVGEGWHADVTFEDEPPMGSMLYIKEMPASGCGGDTMFANMYLAYECLSPAMQSFLEGLTAVHTAETLAKQYGFTIPEGGYPEGHHPVVVRHPVTGRKLLYVSPGFTSHIVELSRRESDVLLDLLYRQTESNPAIICRIPWQANSMVFWDNRCTQHHAVWDYAPMSRYGERVTVKGHKPSA